MFVIFDYHDALQKDFAKRCGPLGMTVKFTCKTIKNSDKNITMYVPKIKSAWVSQNMQKYSLLTSQVHKKK